MLAVFYRNFLHGRIAANSLLGSVELERVLPTRQVQIFVGTWNMNGQVRKHHTDKTTCRATEKDGTKILI